MTRLAEHWLNPGLWMLAELSIRWGLVIGAVMAWLVVHPPRRAATRHGLCLAALAAGVILPLSPRWGEAVIPWPVRKAEIPAPPEVVAVIPRPAEVSLPPGDRVEVEIPRPEPVSISAPASVNPRWPAARVIAATAAASAWGAVVLAMLARLAGGWLTLDRMRREAEASGRVSDPLLDECRGALGLSRRAGLASHPSVRSPAVVGGWRPLVLVPTDWGDWPEPRRRACLLHELAHLARHDDWARLAQELVRAPFFFHPLVHWLLARLDRERELLCDEEAVRLGSDPIDYARLLLDLARRPGRLRPAIAPPRPGWLPFLDRRTVPVRIARLLEEDMPSTLSRPSAGRSLLIVGLALTAGLILGGLRVRAGSAATPQAPASKPAAAPAPEKTLEELRGVVVDAEGHPVADLPVAAAIRDDRWATRRLLTTDAQGRFSWRLPPGTHWVEFITAREGFIPAYNIRSSTDPIDRGDARLVLHKAVPFSATLVDDAGKPVAGASVRIEMMANSYEVGSGRGMSFTYLRREIVAGTPLERLVTTTTDAAGAFTFRLAGPDSGLKLTIEAGGRSMRIKPRTDLAGQTRRMLEESAFSTAPPGEATRLVAIPAARVAGRVVTRLQGVPVSGLKVTYQDSHPPGRYRPTTNYGDEVATDAEGRFAFEGLSEGTVNVFVQGDGEKREWTYRAAQDVPLTPGKTAEVTLELIRGVEVEGTVVAQGTRMPVEGAHVGVYGPNRPRTSGMTSVVRTDDRGHFHYRLPSGETYFYVIGPPKGFTRLTDRTVTIPEGVSRYEVPAIEVAEAVTVRGRILDATGSPVANARVVGTCEGGVCRPFPGDETVTDNSGAFRLPPGMNNTVAIGKPARLLVRLPDGAEHEVAAVPAKDGSVTLELPIAGAMAGRVEGPRDVAPDELAGVVVDTDGKPIGGAEVDAWTWYPGHEAKTNAKGIFRIRRLDRDRKAEVVVRRDGYTPQLFLMQPVGRPGWVVVLGRKTYFEGRVTAPDGKPVAGALIRANCGPKMADGVSIGAIWTEATTDEEGRYRMYAHPDIYDVQVRVPGVGVARLPGTSLGADEARRLDIALESGVTFRAHVVDSLTDDPVAGVRLWDWQHPGVEGRSKEDGLVTIPGMMPGTFRFRVEALGFVRWWSDQATQPWGRRMLDPNRGGWQRNFDPIEFDLKPGMEPVTLTVERGATVTGRVLDPDGKPVPGATVAPALTGTGNSLTGDTRFSVQTDGEGRFTAVLPASGPREYNLVAHDGPFGHWRTWANGVMPPIRTKPGETLRDVEIRLTKPATVRGRVIDAKGNPVARREVRASAADRLENRYYDPTARTSADGSYELKFIRPGEQFVQVAPFWLDARQAPEGTSRTLKLAPGESRSGVDFRLPPGHERR